MSVDGVLVFMEIVILLQLVIVLVGLLLATARIERAIESASYKIARELSVEFHLKDDK